MPVTLPYDIVLLILSYLDPIPVDEAPLIDTPSSALRHQREVGSTISLLSRDYVRHGQQLVFKHVVLSFSKEQVARRKLVLLVGNDHLADKVKRLFVFAGTHDVERTLALPLDLLLPSLTHLASLEVSSTPALIERLVNPSSLVSARHLVHLTLISGHAASPNYPSYLLAVLPQYLPDLESLTLRLQLSTSGSVPSRASIPNRRKAFTRLRSFEYSVMDSTTGQTHLAADFLDALLDLVDGPTCPLSTLKVSSRTLPDSLAPFVRSCRSLEHLTIECGRMVLETYLDSFLESVRDGASSSTVRTLSLGVLPTWVAPLSPSRESVDLLLETLSSLERIENVSLDFDLSSYEPDVREYLTRQTDANSSTTTTLESFVSSGYDAVGSERLAVVWKRRRTGGWTREQDLAADVW
ncbi:hypothetical protein JCM10212_002192 [Sporobolomyces blumeae]